MVCDCVGVRSSSDQVYSRKMEYRCRFLARLEPGEREIESTEAESVTEFCGFSVRTVDLDLAMVRTEQKADSHVGPIVSVLKEDLVLEGPGATVIDIPVGIKNYQMIDGVLYHCVTKVQRRSNASLCVPVSLVNRVCT